MTEAEVGEPPPVAPWGGSDATLHDTASTAQVDSEKPSAVHCVPVPLLLP